MSEAIDWSSQQSPALPQSEELEDWPKPDLQIVQSLPEVPTMTSDEAFILNLVAKGETVVSYLQAHRKIDGRPTTFYPQYPV